MFRIYDYLEAFACPVFSALPYVLSIIPTGSTGVFFGITQPLSLTLPRVRYLTFTLTIIRKCSLLNLSATLSSVVYSGTILPLLTCSLAISAETGNTSTSPPSIPPAVLKLTIFSAYGPIVPRHNTTSVSPAAASPLRYFL